jgi:seryl-tRNA synthetase
LIDPKILKERPELLKDMLRRRKINFPLDELIELDKNRRHLISSRQDIRHRKNVISEQISNKKKEKSDLLTELNEMKDIGILMKHLDSELSTTEYKFNELMLSIPNLLDDTVPDGNDSSDNKIVRTVGEVNNGILNYLDHVDLCTSLQILDLERASKVAGARFYFLKNDLVKLNQALIFYALNFLEEHGYTLVQPPFILKLDAIKGAVILSDLQDVIYKIDKEDMYMIGTSEHAIASMHMDEILDGNDLPLKYGGVSPCFRKEAGAHGKDTKGIFRVHQFEKVEQFVYCKQENSTQEHEKMLELTEKFYQALGIPYRVVLLCSADVGKVSAKTYDIEAWFPGQGAFREIVSCSSCIDFQARRLSIRYRDKVDEDTRLVHTLNSTLVATERTMVAIVENYQTSDGRIIIPPALRKYMSDQSEIKVR